MAEISLSEDYSDLPEHLRPIARMFYEALVDARREGRITPDKPITGRQISLRWPVLKGSIEVRMLVHYWRERGALIASSAEGYFYAITPDEMEETLNHLRGRRNSIQTVVSALEASVQTLKATTGAQHG